MPISEDDVLPVEALKHDYSQAPPIAGVRISIPAYNFRGHWLLFEKVQRKGRGKHTVRICSAATNQTVRVKSAVTQKDDAYTEYASCEKFCQSIWGSTVDQRLDLSAILLSPGEKPTWPITTTHEFLYFFSIQALGFPPIRDPIGIF
jgi:hypothetical protein